MHHTSALVWLKRDLRTRDHAPLSQAQQFASAFALFAIEPEWLESEEFDSSHAEFALKSLQELQARLRALGLPLLIRHGSMIALLTELHHRFAFTHLLSHEETGPGWTWTRDRAVKRWCETHRVVWVESPQSGVVRRLADRRGWAGRWQQRMDAQEAQPLTGFNQEARRLAESILGAGEPSPGLRDLNLASSGKSLQAAGESAAWQTLESFLTERGHGYRKAISSPLTAADGGSRLSPHLAFGTISLRCVHQATEHAIAHAEERGARHALRGFSGRLRWHCHFMQKLEDEPAIEFRNFARHCDGLREDSFREDLFAAWCEGRTGFPMVDACMRSLRATGWLNFRMRAMLVSFAAYHLWLHWRPTGLFLARQFLDFEAGIHWSQMQMQSGTTGINTFRIYSPTKQARDHDPDGEFIRRWVPELREVPTPMIATPWLMDPAMQSASGCQIGRDYPEPLVDERGALQSARERLYGLRASETARSEADRIQRKHGSRRSGLPQSGKGGTRGSEGGPLSGGSGAPPGEKAARSRPNRSRASRTEQSGGLQLDLFDSPESAD